MTRLLALFALCLSCAEFARAGGMLRQWINAHDSCHESQIWFMHSVVLGKKVKRAWVDVASNGRVAVYVNGYNTSTDVLTPYRPGDRIMRSFRCETTPYICSDTCHLAVWYSPFLKGYNGRQLSLTFYGTYTDGSHFAFETDGNWSWTPAPASTRLSRGETEHIAYGSTDVEWLFDDSPLPSLLPVNVTVGSEITLPARPLLMRHIYPCRLVISSPTSLTYLSPHPFRGWVRVTLRGMKKSQPVTVNGLHYTCGGILDEQACRRFTIPDDKTTTIRISSPVGIRESNIMSVEAIDIY
ncbi:MAG: hypothetical protein MR717_03330 [Prevotella sp.]|nr:hypothetical protein [Prevotella sp.]